jgi:hypothetical protein
MMGREIRRVPANWDHPKQERYPDRFQPMFDETFETAAKNWKESFAEWESGVRPSYCSEDSATLEYWEWDGTPPDREYYRPWKDEEATWYQAWETVSEGTPVSPPFETQAELVDYLTANGDFWDQKRGDKPLSREAYEKFVNGGWAPSLMMIGGKVMSGVEAMAIDETPAAAE